MTVLNPDSIGNPNQTPIVRVTPDLAALLKPCQQRGSNGEFCGGVNGFHRDTCLLAASGLTFHRSSLDDETGENDDCGLRHIHDGSEGACVSEWRLLREVRG